MAMATGSTLAAFFTAAATDSIFDTSSTRSFRGSRLVSFNYSAQVTRFSSSRSFTLVRAAASSSSTSSPSTSSTISSKPVTQNEKAKSKNGNGEVKMIATQKEFETVLRQAGDKLVVVEYAASHSVNSKKIYPTMVELSRTCPDVVFRLILGDESDDTKEIFRQAGVVSVPHFIFYKNMEKIHEEEGITEDMLLGDVLYYGDSSNAIEQLHSRSDVESLIKKHKSDGKLIVLDVGLKHCGPCVKVYPTVIKLAKKMSNSTVFARMHGDENDDCMALLKELNVLEVPTFLFIRDGEVMGRYVGSGRGELIGEILKHQGVRVTY